VLLGLDGAAERGAEADEVSANAPDRMLDPICDMIVAVGAARTKGRTVEHQGRTYALCSNGCVSAFNADRARWATNVDVASAAKTRPDAAVIDDGMRRWYESCRCCLSDAYPDVVAQLDAVRDAAAAH
jgi:YHS domain-containing protein